ncbi:hypothetical protein GKN96_24330, partial [Klebsiella pneumoniae]|nr:hypothetical protein [Klebsiella pneumoniae]
MKLTDKPRSFGIASWTVIHPFSAIRIAKTPPERGKDRTQPRLISHRNWSPPFGGGTHTALPLPDRDL